MSRCNRCTIQKLLKELLAVLAGIVLSCIFCSCKRSDLPDPQVVPGPILQTTQRILITLSPTPAFHSNHTPTPSVTVVLSTEPTPVHIIYEVPTLSQDGLFLDGVPTGVGCVPVCIEMMTSYWNKIEPIHPILTAQEVIDRNAPEGLYAAGRGMSSASAADELEEIGYAHEMKLNSSKEELLEYFTKHGPIGVLVKTNWIPTTMNHAAVLTEYDEESDTVTLNDPFYGSTVTWSWESFDGIWGLNYAGDRDYSGSVVRRVFFSIYPLEQ